MFNQEQARPLSFVRASRFRNSHCRVTARPGISQTFQRFPPTIQFHGLATIVPRFRLIHTHDLSASNPRACTFQVHRLIKEFPRDAHATSLRIQHIGHKPPGHFHGPSASRCDSRVFQFRVQSTTEPHPPSIRCLSNERPGSDQSLYGKRMYSLLTKFLKRLSNGCDSAL